MDRALSPWISAATNGWLPHSDPTSLRSDKNRLTSSRPDAVLVAPIPAKTENKRVPMEGGRFFGVAGGN